MDGVGEWATTSSWIGRNNELKPLWEISFLHSLGLLYSAFTYFCGFKVNSGEYKLMGLAPYGEPKYVKKIRDNLIDIKEDGTFRLDISYFKFHSGFRMTSRKFHNLFGSKPRVDESALTQFHMDLAASIQVITEEIVLKLAKSLHKETGIKNLTLIKYLGSYDRYKIGKDPRIDDKSERKKIELFLFETDEMVLNPQDSDNPEARWVKPAEVSQYLTHEKDIAFFQSILGDIDQAKRSDAL